MHEIDLILTLTAGLSAALAFGYLAFRLKLPTIVGYLFAGMLLGPKTPGFVANREVAEQFAEIGIILLMFGVGLQFHWKDLLAVKNVAVAGALGAILCTGSVAAGLARAWGWQWPASIVFAIGLAVASTVVLTKVLEDNDALKSPVGKLAVGWLVVEDIFTIFVLVVLPAAFAAGGENSLGAAVLWGSVKLLLVIGLTLGPGAALIPKLLTGAARARSRELFTLAVLVAALGISVGSAKVFDVSIALGAFLAGMVVGQSEFGLRAATEALPFRDAFSVLFFVSIGMLFDPMFVVNSPWQALAAVGIVVLVKPLVAFAAMAALGNGVANSVAVALALGQIGEFSFIVAAAGRQLKLLPEGATECLVAAAIFSITVNPLLYRFGPRIVLSIESVGWLQRLLERPLRRKVSGNIREDGRPFAVVVGYGPVGKTVSQLLARQDIETAVIEMNLETVKRLQKQGLRAYYGNAAQAQVLIEAGLRKAVVLVIGAQGSIEVPEIIRVAREVNPGIPVFARTRYGSGSKALIAAGADAVFSEDAEVGLALLEAVMERVGASAEQLDGARDRARRELYGG